MKFNKRLIMMTGMSATALLVLAGCGKANKSADKQVIRTSTDQELTTVDISKANAVGSFNILNNIDEGLVRLGKNSKVEPGIAEKTTVSKDGKTYTFNLRKNAKWSNGDPVTAQDFVYSWQRTLNPKTASEYGYLFSGIKNADKIQKSQAPVSSLGIKANGKYKLTVNLEKQIPYFKLLMGFPVFYPQNQKAVEKAGSNYGTAAKYTVYNGPFKLNGWTGTNLSWTLQKNSDYWDKDNVKADAIKFKVVKDPSTGLNLYNEGKLEMAQLSATQSKQMGAKKDMVNRKQSGTYYLAFNQTNPKFANKKIRQAMSMAINRDTMTHKVIGGAAVENMNFVTKELAVSPTTKKDFTAETTIPDTMKYNPTKAKQLFKEGLQEIGEKSLSITLLNSDGYDQKQLSEYLQSTLEKNLPGLKVTLNNIPGRALLDRQANHKFEVTVANWFADFSDPITFLDILTSKNTNNKSQWKNAEYDRLIDNSNEADGNKPAKRWQDMIAAQNLALKEQAIVPLYQSGETWLINEKLQGVIYNTAGVNYNFKNAHLN